MDKVSEANLSCGTPWC